MPAQSVTVQSLLDDSLRAAGLEYSAPSFVTTTEHLELVRRAHDYYRNKLIDARGAEYFATATSFSTTVGNATYALSTIAPDLFELAAQPIIIVGNHARAMKHWEFRELDALRTLDLSGGVTSYVLRYRLTADAIEIRPIPQGVYTIELRYIPRSPVLVTGAPGVGEVNAIDGYSGFHLWIVYTVAIALRRKRSLDTSELERERMLIDGQIQALASKRNAADAPRVVSRGNPWSLSPGSIVNPAVTDPYLDLLL